MCSFTKLYSDGLKQHELKKYQYQDLLQQKAKILAAELQLTEFKASNKLLDSQKARHNTSQMAINGESGLVNL